MVAPCGDDSITIRPRMPASPSCSTSFDGVLGGGALLPAGGGLPPPPPAGGVGCACAATPSVVPARTNTANRRVFIVEAPAAEDNAKAPPPLARRGERLRHECDVVVDGITGRAATVGRRVG